MGLLAADLLWESTGLRKLECKLQLIFFYPHPPVSSPTIYVHVLLFHSFSFAAMLLERMPRIIQMFPLVYGLQSNCYRINIMVFV